MSPNLVGEPFSMRRKVHRGLKQVRQSSQLMLEPVLRQMSHLYGATARAYIYFFARAAGADVLRAEDIVSS